MNKKKKSFLSKYEDEIGNMDNLERRGSRGFSQISRGESQIDITITRSGVLTGLKLPFVLFGYQELSSAFNELISVPAAVTAKTLQSSRTGYPSLNIDETKSDMVFSYTTVGGTDTITVSCPNYPYNALLEALSSNVFKINRMKYTISDPNQVQQFSEQLVVHRRSMFGKSSDDRQTPSAFKDTEQFQDGIIDIPITMSVNKELALITNIVAVDGLTVTLSLFIDNVNKRD